jgi:chromosome segregation ATPase
MMGVVFENTSFVQNDMYNPGFQSPGNVESHSQLESLRARTHAAEEIADQMLDDLTAVQEQLQQALADNKEKDRRIHELEMQVSGQQDSTEMGVGTTTAHQAHFGGFNQQNQEALNPATSVHQQAALTQMEGSDAKLRELERLVEFFKGNSEQSAKKVRILQEENRRLKGMIPPGLDRSIK